MVSSSTIGLFLRIYIFNNFTFAFQDYVFSTSTGKYLASVQGNNWANVIYILYMGCTLMNESFSLAIKTKILRTSFNQRRARTRSKHNCLNFNVHVDQINYFLSLHNIFFLVLVDLLKTKQLISRSHQKKQ